MSKQIMSFLLFYSVEKNVRLEIIVKIYEGVLFNIKSCIHQYFVILSTTEKKPHIP